MKNYKTNFIYSFLSLGVLLTLVSCGASQVAFDDDGIYSKRTRTPQKREVVENKNNQENYFTKELQRLKELKEGLGEPKHNRDYSDNDNYNNRNSTNNNYVIVAPYSNRWGYTPNYLDFYFDNYNYAYRRGYYRNPYYDNFYYDYRYNGYWDYYNLPYYNRYYGYYGYNYCPYYYDYFGYGYYPRYNRYYDGYYRPYNRNRVYSRTYTEKNSPRRARSDNYIRRNTQRYSNSRSSNYSRSRSYGRSSSYSGRSYPSSSHSSSSSSGSKYRSSGRGF